MISYFWQLRIVLFIYLFIYLSIYLFIYFHQKEALEIFMQTISYCYS